MLMPPTPAKSDVRRWIVTFGGAGLSPYAPGTAGSLAASLLLYGIYMALSDGTPGAYWRWQAALAGALVLSSVLSVALGHWATAAFARKDPQPFVLDEVAGICLTLLGQIAYNGWREIAVVAGAFAAFRVFDIVKPPPARQLERLPEGWGILLDDLAAAVYANLLCQAFFRGLWS
jgi:phosphatidylglycerophosphatase A